MLCVVQVHQQVLKDSCDPMQHIRILHSKNGPADLMMGSIQSYMYFFLCEDPRIYPGPPKFHKARSDLQFSPFDC